MRTYLKGFLLIEIIIVIAIIAIIVSISLPSLNAFRNRQALVNTTEDIVSLLNTARIQTLSSLNGNFYGVHFTSTTATLFSGGTYDSGDITNKVINFDSFVILPAANISLNGAGVDVNFNRLTGDTSQYGTITLQLTSDSATQKVITVNKTGVISSN